MVLDLFDDSLPHTAAQSAHGAAHGPDRALRGPVRPAGLAARSASGKVDVEFTLAKLKPDETPWAYFLQIVMPDGKLLANVNTYPAYGVLSTNYLPQNTVLHEFLRASG